ncbi:MAG TPA: hypothetical protein VE954_01245 [Oligoflexus sp.]|uniref:hypothetical protein n=1 Tax=Oligoflexus sp. TaxID=1971216 RepID=UPI002D422B3B|nr:hypothetical protein [Oligoflexus sp.]HYX31707.1 hypothetical protein [Oligoflexus sp.]
MVRLLFILALLGLMRQARADDIADPMTWWNQLSESVWQQPTLLRNITIRTGNATKARRWDKTMADFSGLGFVQYVPIEDMDFMRRLNPKEDLSELPNDLLLDPDLLQMVLVDRGTKMSVLSNTSKHYKSLGSWPLSAQDRKNSSTMLTWMSRNLGYDAVVLDARDGLILAGLLKNTSELGQGLLVKQSAKRWVIKESNTRGEALLQMLKTNGSLAVFEVLLAKGKTLEVEKGSKILLGQNNNWMKIMQPDAASKTKTTSPEP